MLLIAGLVALIGVAASTFLMWRAAVGRAAAFEAEAMEAQEELEALRAQLVDEATQAALSEQRISMSDREIAQLRLDKDRLETERNRLEVLKSAQEAEARAREEHHQQEIARLNSLQGDLKRDFEALVGKTFANNQDTFLKLANEVMSKHREATQEATLQHKEGLGQLLEPIKEQLKRYEEGLKAYDKDRLESFNALKTEIGGLIKGQEAVSKEAARLVHALTAYPKMRGRWGEEQLKNIIELAGMSPYADFQTEVSVSTEEGRLRPDVVIRLPGGRCLVVDSKVSLNAYLGAAEAVEEAQREALLDAHAKDVRRHMELLASKRYWSQFDNSMDCVVMFIPGDNFLAAAAERDPDLFNDGFEKGVIVATPSILIALAKSAALGWRQEKMAQNAKEVSSLGQELYERLAVMGGHVAALGQSLDGAIAKYNQMIGSLEDRVMPQARKFLDLHVAPPDKEIKALEPIERAVREPRKGRDLKLGEAEAPQSQAEITRLRGA